MEFIGVLIENCETQRIPKLKVETTKLYFYKLTIMACPLTAVAKVAKTFGTKGFISIKRLDCACKTIIAISKCGRFC
jgi:hypothetical protein